MGRLLVNKRNLVNYNSLRCKTCGGKFTQQQINKAKSKHSIPQYCSIECTRKGGSNNEESIKDPKNEVERVSFDRIVANGKAELVTDEQAIVAKYTPVDDSPEAERIMREAICPNPLYGKSSMTKYDVKIKDMGYHRRSVYRE